MALIKPLAHLGTLGYFVGISDVRIRIRIRIHIQSFLGWIRIRIRIQDFFYDQLDSNPDSDSEQLDSDSDPDSRKKGWIRIQLDSDSKGLDSDPDSDSRCPDSHITGRN